MFNAWIEKSKGLLSKVHSHKIVQGYALPAGQWLLKTTIVIYQRTRDARLMERFVIPSTKKCLQFILKSCRDFQKTALYGRHIAPRLILLKKFLELIYQKLSRYRFFQHIFNLPSHVLAISCIALGFLILMVPMNRYISSSMDKRIQLTPIGQTTDVTQFFGSGDSKSVLPKEPDNPGRYNMLVQDQFQKPTNQQEWDLLVNKSIIRSNALFRLEENNNLQNIHKSQEEINSQLTNIDQRIEYVRSAIQSRPQDTELQKRLERLYMQRATLLALQDRLMASPEKK